MTTKGKIGFGGNAIGWMESRNVVFNKKYEEQVASVFLGVEKMLIQNTLLPRWSDEIKNHAYAEDEKQCLNGMICWFLAKEAAKKDDGKNVDFNLFPKIAIKRGFEKFVKKDIREEVFSQISEMEPEMLVALNNYIDECVKEMTTEEFGDFLEIPEDSYERMIYKAATAIATYIEFRELRERVYIADEDFSKKEKIQMQRISKYKDIPGVEEILLYKGDLYRLFEHFSKLRNQVRWVGKPCKIKFNDLGHSYHAACISYVSLLANGETEEEATKGYFTMLFHDIAERWTGDFPSPLKDAVKAVINGKTHTLREYIDRIEIKTLQNHVYTRIPKDFLPDFRGIMLEELEPDKKRKFKEADSVSAVVEGYENIKDGSGDEYLFNFVKESFLKDSWTRSISILFKGLERQMMEERIKRFEELIEMWIAK